MLNPLYVRYLHQLLKKVLKDASFQGQDHIKMEDHTSCEV